MTEPDPLAARVHALIAPLRQAKTFIEYARYELQPGKATFPDQFPKQEDADVVIAALEAALAAAREPETEK